MWRPRAPLDFPPRASLRAERVELQFTFRENDPSVYRITFAMSDYEDEMDVDAPSKVQFTSDNASGKKRTAADLPIAAQDNLPWYARHLHSSSTKLTICIGSRSTAQTAWRTSPVIKISLQPSTDLSKPMYFDTIPL